MSDDNYTAVILEEIRDQNKAVLEAVGQMQDQMKMLATKDELQAVADDVKVIKLAIADTSHDLVDHEQRITALEQTAP
jgi:hypothetical protein